MIPIVVLAVTLLVVHAVVSVLEERVKIRQAALLAEQLQQEDECLGQFMEGNEMLVLSRKNGEQLVIGNDIVITIVDIRGDKVRLGFDAPVSVPIFRSEVLSAIIAQQQKEGAESKADQDGTAEVAGGGRTTAGIGGSDQAKVRNTVRPNRLHRQ